MATGQHDRKNVAPSSTAANCSCGGPAGRGYGPLVQLERPITSVSGEILARIVDRKRMGNYGHMQWSNSVTNRAEAQRLFARWAKMLREGLDEIHDEKFQADQAVQ